MTSSRQHKKLTFGTGVPTANAALAFVIVLALAVVVAHSAQAQTFKVIYNFTSGQDGANPMPA